MLWRQGRAYAQDLRERVFAAGYAGQPVGRIAEVLFVSISYVAKVLSRRSSTGETTARPQRCHVPRKLRKSSHRDPRAGGGSPGCDDRGTAAVAAGDLPDIGQRDIAVGNPGSSRADANKKTLHAAEQNRPDVAKARTEWREERVQPEPGKTDLHRRDRDQDQSGPPVRWSFTARHTADRYQPARSLEDPRHSSPVYEKMV